MQSQALLVALLVLALVFQAVSLFSTASEREREVVLRRLTDGGLRAESGPSSTR